MRATLLFCYLFGANLLKSANLPGGREASRVNKKLKTDRESLSPT